MSPMAAYLLDTHTLYWHIWEPAKLSASARTAIDDGEAGNAVIIVYHIVLAELCYLLQKLNQEKDFPAALALLAANPNYRMEPMALADIENLRLYPDVTEMHDRLIVAAANRLGAILLTKDRNIQASSQVKWLW